MRSISLWLCALACLVAASHAIELPNIEEPEEDVLDELAEDEDVDMRQLLGDLFEDEEIDETDDDDEEETGRQMATVTMPEQERYNTFMDTLLSQLKRQAKRDLEPLKVTLTPAKKNKKNGKKNSRKNSKKNTKKEKNKRDPKDIDLPEIADTEQEVHQIQKREAEAEEEVTGRKTNDENKEKKNGENQGKRNKKGRNNNKKNKKTKNNRRQGRSNNKVILHGLSHITREGDVKLYNMKNGRSLVTEFIIGPVELDVTRTFGSGEQSKAAASANELRGKLMLKVNKQGKPRIKKLSLKRPKDITMSGSLARSHNSNSGKGFMKKSVKQVSPTAAKRLLRAAKAIIQSSV